MLESVTYVPGMKCYPSIRKGSSSINELLPISLTRSTP
jgi:hypothetical protein